jgi:hypothetical protein
MTMQNPSSSQQAPLVLSFSTLDEATAAQDALAAAGVQRDAMDLSVREDEAGPASGNFLIGNGQTEHGGAPAAVRTGPEVPYDENFRNPEYRGAYLLVVQVGAEQRERIESVLARFDSVAASEVADAGAGPKP